MNNAINEQVKSLSHVRLFATPWTVAHQAPLSMGFSRNLPNPGIEPLLLHWQAGSLPLSPQRSPYKYIRTYVHIYTHTRILCLLFFNMYLYIYFWLCGVFVAVHGLSLVAMSRSYFLMWESVRASPCGFSVCRAGPWGLQASVLVLCGLSCSMACGLFPDQGSEPTSPALAGGLLTTGPPGKSVECVFFIWMDTDYSHVLSIEYSAAANTGVHVCFQIVVSSKYYFFFPWKSFPYIQP